MQNTQQQQEQQQKPQGAVAHRRRGYPWAGWGWGMGDWQLEQTAAPASGMLPIARKWQQNALQNASQPLSSSPLVLPTYKVVCVCV